MELTNTAQAQPVGQQDKSSLNGISDQFSFEEFFDFSNEDDDDIDQLLSDNLNADALHSRKAESESLLGDSSCNSSMADFGSSILTSDLCVPYDDLAELEWVSTFTEESFSSEDMEKLQFISGLSSTRSEENRPDPNTTTNYRSEVHVPGKARSKRPRTALENWTSRLLLVSELEMDSDPNPVKRTKIDRKYRAEYLPVDGRKCLHCQTDTTPQWRTGPLGPKTLCNACGVRYKSGRLVPEYRPASSPTFVQTEHSNSHRKVLELRKKKESIMGVGTHYQLHDRYLKQYSNMRNDGSDYLIHRPDFGELI